MGKNTKIAIIGRPNVGKSTLFNRLSSSRISIVDETEGVTRDRVYASGEWINHKFDVIDTGGFIGDNNDFFNQKIKEQIGHAIEECDVIVMLVDGKDGLNPADRFLSQLVKKSSKPSFLTINKNDSSKIEENLHEFYELGWDQLFSISALNGSGVGELLDEILKSSSSNLLHETEEKILSISIVGMPNVGKSSILNAILQKDQAIVSDIAGTTRDSIDTNIKWHGKQIRIIDTAGLRKKSKIDDSIEFYSSLRAMDALLRSDIVLLVIDAIKGISKQDKSIVNEVLKKGKRLIILINKWDLTAESNISADTFKEDMYYDFPLLQNYPLLFVSAKTKKRISNILESAWELYNKNISKISTKELNNWLEKVLVQHSPPAIQGKLIKIKFVEQVHINPPIFAFFTNYPKLISVSYKRFLMNKLRESFDLNGITFKLSIRKG